MICANRAGTCTFLLIWYEEEKTSIINENNQNEQTKTTKNKQTFDANPINAGNITAIDSTDTKNSMPATTLISLRR